jgi:hypothetical protein
VVPDVAVEHVRQVGIGVVAEAHDEADILSRRDVDRVLEAAKMRWGRSARVLQDF